MLDDLIQYHNEELEGRWEGPYGKGDDCGISTANPKGFTENDVLDHVCWVVVGRKPASGNKLFFLGMRFTIKEFYEEHDPPYTYKANGPGESFLIPLAGDWFDRLYRKKQLFSFGFHFISPELAQHFERVVEEEHLRQRK